MHKIARTTTPAIRAKIAASSANDPVLMTQYGVSRATIQSWRHQQSTADLSLAAHHLPTTKNTDQDEFEVYLGRQLPLPLDDLQAVINELIDELLTRSALHRMLRR